MRYLSTANFRPLGRKNYVFQLGAYETSTDSLVSTVKVSISNCFMSFKERDFSMLTLYTKRILSHVSYNTLSRQATRLPTSGNQTAKPLRLLDRQLQAALPLR